MHSMSCLPPPANKTTVILSYHGWVLGSKKHILTTSIVRRSLKKKVFPEQQQQQKRFTTSPVNNGLKIILFWETRTWAGRELVYGCVRAMCAPCFQCVIYIGLPLEHFCLMFVSFQNSEYSHTLHAAVV